MRGHPNPFEAFGSEDYDEFQFLERHARWAGLPWSSLLSVARSECMADRGLVSYLRWGTTDPEVVLLHGSGQNAHTWDTFALALSRPCIALDLPGHGRSDWRPDGDYLPEATAPAVAQVVARVAPTAKAVVGMSLGGLTALRLASLRPDLVRALVLVDITPGRPEIPERDVAGRQMSLSLLAGPQRYPSWESMLDATHATMPHRERESVAPGLRHNAKRFEDGSWGWRYDRMRSSGDPRPALDLLWGDLASLRAPLLLVRGGLSPIVGDGAVEQLRRHSPHADVVTIPEAGHSVQTDRPLELASIINGFLL